MTIHYRKQYNSFVLFLLIFLTQNFLFSQTTYTWNGSISTNWSTAGNWTPAAVPLSTDHVVIVSTGNNPVLAANTTITNFTMTSGVLDLNGFTLNTQGVHAFTAGTIQNGALVSFAGVSSVFTNTTFAANLNLNIASGAITINGGTFNGGVDLNMNGSGNTTGTGNAIFNGTTVLRNSGTGYFRTNGNMTFNGATSFILSGSGYMLFELSSGNTYNGSLTLTLTATATADLRMGYTGTTNYNGNIFVNNLSTNTIRFGEQVTATNNLNAGATITVGGLGFSSGFLNLRRFYQLGGTAQNMTLTGTGYIHIITCSFSGNVTITSPEFELTNTVYDGVVIFTKTGPLSNATSGGNTFNQTLTVNHNGATGYWSFGNGSPDVYNGDVFSNNNSQDRIIFGHNSGGNQFNGNIVLTQIGSSQGTALTWGSGTATIAATKTISLGVGGYSVGWLYLERVTQLGTTPINLTLTGSTSIYLGPTSTFGGAVTVNAPSIYARGATYNSPVNFTKTGSTNDHNNGNQNVFNSTLEINQQGSGYFMVGYNSNDLFNDNITVTSTNSGGINFGWPNGTGTPTLAAGKTISVGGAGFTQGYLRFGTFTQLGSTPISLNIDGADFYVENANGPSVFGGNLNVTASSLYIRGGTFNGATAFTKTGTVSNHNNGFQNIFNSTLVINQQGTGYFMLGYNSNDLFNDHITVTSTNTGTIYLGYSAGTGTPTLSATKSIFIGGGGFTQGYLYLGDFTQLGNAPINLNMGSNASLNFKGCNIGGAVTSTSGSIFFSNSVFNGAVSFDKTGSNNDASVGGNTFHQTTVIENSGTGYILTANGSPDIYNTNLTLINNGSDNLYLGYNSIGNIINGNLDIQNTASAAQVRVLENNSTLTVNGTTTISNTSVAPASYIFYSLLGNLTQNGSIIAVNNSSGDFGQISFANSTNSVLNVTGNMTCTNSPTGLNGDLYVGNQGTINLAGQLTADNVPTGNSGQLFVANGGNSAVTIGGATNITNSGAGTTKRAWIGNDGDITFNGTLTLVNNATATNSAIRCNHGATSSNQYNQNIIVSNPANNEGILFGAGTGSGTLAATRTITIGVGGFISGSLYFRNFTQVGPTAQTLITTGTTLVENYSSNWGGNIDFRGGRILTRETTYNGTAYLEKHGTSNDPSAGGNIFHGNTELRNNGSGYFLMGNGLPDVFDLNLIMTNSGTYRMYLAHNSAGNSIGGNLTVTNTGSAADNDIYCVNTGISTLTIGGNASITNSSTATSSTIYFPTDGTVSVAGNLIGNNNGLANTSQISIANSTTSSITIAGNATLNNAGSLTTSRVYVGNSGDVTINGTLTLNNNSGATNSEMFCNHAVNSVNNYNGNIVVSTTNASSDGIRFGENNGSATLAASRTVTIGGGGFSAGLLYFRNFTQVGPTAQTLITTGTTHFENYNSNWGGNVDFRGSRMFTRGTTYQGTVYLEKFGALDDASVGGNVVFGNCELKNTGSGYFLMGNGNPDNFQLNLLMNNTGTWRMYLAHNSTGNNVGGNLTVNNTASGADNSIWLVNSALSTLNVGGNVILNNSSSATTATVYFPEDGSATVGGNVTANNFASGPTGQIILANTSNSSLVISGSTQLTNTGSGTTKRTYVGNNGDITFNGPVTANNSSSATNSEMFFNHSGNSANAYNHNLVLQNTNASGDGIFFGNNSGSGTLAATRTVTIGGGGFVAGTLQFRNFTQLSATAQSITLTGVGTIFENYNSLWNGSVNFIAPRHFTRGTTYNGNSYLEKNGASNDASVGGNVFNANVEFLVSGTGYFMPSNTTGDDHNGNVIYTKTGTGLMYPAYNSTSTYAGNLTINSNTVITFADAGNGRVEFDGGSAQTVNNTGAANNHIIRRITTSKTANDVTLNTPINVSHDVTFGTGNITTSAVNLLIMLAGSGVTNPSDLSYVNGPVRKVGNTLFQFPTGKNGFYRPATISAPSNAAHHFTAEYFFADPVSQGYNDMSLESPLVYVSDCEFWIINRTNGTSNVSVNLSYRTVGVNGCSGVVDPTTLRVARWDGGMWRNHGNGGTTGVASNGSIITAAPVTSFSPFTLATIDLINPLPIELISFKVTCENDDAVISWTTASEVNNDFFTIERSADGINWEQVKVIDGAQNSSAQIEYKSTDNNPLSGTSYYRLKQTDLNGDFEYSDIVSLTNCNGLSGGNNYSVYPNPSNGILNFESRFETDFEITISDLNGRVIYKSMTVSSGNNMLDLEGLSRGVYLINFIVDGTSYTERLVLN